MIINNTEHYDAVRETINMSNMKKLIDSKDYSVTKLAMNACISDSSINSYINGNKLPSVTNLVSIANYLNCNIDFLLGIADNNLPIEKLNSLSKDYELSILINNMKRIRLNGLHKRKVSILYSIIIFLFLFLKNDC